MTDPAHRATAWLLDALAARIDDGAAGWLHAQLDALALAVARPPGRAPPMLGKAALAPSTALAARAHDLRAGFDASAWSVDQAARVLFVLATWDGDAAAFVRRIDRLAGRAEVTE